MFCGCFLPTTCCPFVFCHLPKMSCVIFRGLPFVEDMLSDVLLLAISPKTCCPKFCGLLFCRRRVVQSFVVCYSPKTCCLMFCGCFSLMMCCLMLCILPFAKDELCYVLGFAICRRHVVWCFVVCHLPKTSCVMFFCLPFSEDVFVRCLVVRFFFVKFSILRS